MKAGAEDFLEKDDDVADRLEIMLDRMGRHLDVMAENRRLRDENSALKTRVDVYKEEIYRKYQIVGVSAAMRKVCAMVERVAPIPRPVLVVGERGTGKELVAAAIHRASPRRGAPFVTINCAAFAEGLLECELYGQEENAFTNAPFRRGRFEQADGGTLFMDEVANMPLPFQQTVLRVLEYQRFERVGGGKTLQVDVRVVGATNADLAVERRAGRFRDDLYDRLAFETVVLPPLRERPEDVGPLARHFLGLIRLEVPEIRPRDFDDEALERLTTYPWPGNVRELKHYVERAAYRADAEILTTHELPPLEPGA
jgi:transcriptional regulator with GAF, ATPase, and Fis domain